MNAKQKGFTLIELLIATAILGLLAKIAYPTYMENIQRAKRSEAEAALVSLASALETWRMQNGGSYSAGGPTAATLGFTQVPVSGGTKTYDIAISSLTASAYTLTASPVGSDRCGILGYDNVGAKTASTTGATDCW